MSMTVKQEYDEETVQNFLTEYKWDFLLGGYWDFDRNEPAFVIYTAYRIFIFLIMGGLFILAYAGVFLSTNNVIELIQYVHFGFVLWSCFQSLATRLSSHYTPLYQAMEILKGDVYQYDEELLKEEHRNIRKKYVKEIRDTHKVFSMLLNAVVVSHLVLVPVMNLLFVKEDGTHKTGINPYLPPLPVYFPFDTRTKVGYVFAYLIYVPAVLIIRTMLTGMDGIYVSITLQLQAQFDILSNSLKNIEKRAYSEMMMNAKEKINFLTETKPINIYSSATFRNCMNKCLKSNLEHHHMILKLKGSFEKYIGHLFFYVIVTAASVLAANIVSILESQSPFQTTTFIITLLGELYYIFHYCWNGEEILKVGAALYDTLYSTPWYNCDSGFKRFLIIMLINTKNPYEIKSIVFTYVASLDTMGTIASGLYQMLSLLRSA